MSTPNIIFIMADDLGYGDIACYNPGSKIPTPNIDALARGGVRFTDAHTTSAMCSPTRYSVLTGRYAWRTRLKLGVLHHFAEPLISSRRLTVASMLKRAGYATGCVGKWHLGLGWPVKPGRKLNRRTWNALEDRNVDFARPLTAGPLDLGFDFFFGISASINMVPYCYVQGHRATAIPDRPKEPCYDTDFPGALCAPDFRTEEVGPRLAAEAVGFIDRHMARSPDQPFFLYFPTASIHRPCVPPDFIKGRSRAGLRGDMVVEFDWTVGEVVAALDRHGIRNDTLILVSSDNGPRPGDPLAYLEDLAAKPHGRRLAPRRLLRRKHQGIDRTHAPHYGAPWLLYGHRAAGPWRGFKTDVWDGGHRVPFIASWPNHIAPDTTCDEVLSLSDLMATFAAIVGAELPRNAAEDSYDMLPALLGEPHAGPIREAVVHHSGGGMFAIRQGRWKLVLGRGSGGSSRTPPHRTPGQLYDLAADPAESRNLWSRHPDVVERLTGILERYQHTGRSAPARRR